jgi:small subunit ribosomal protein S1
MIINVDRKTRNISLSIKAKDSAEEAEAVRQHSRDDNAGNAGLAGLGALLKAKQDGNKAE